MTEEDNEVPCWAPRSIWYDSEYFLELKVTIQLSSCLATFTGSGFLLKISSRIEKCHPHTALEELTPCTLTLSESGKRFSPAILFQFCWGMQSVTFKVMTFERNSCMYENSTTLV